MLTDEQKQYIHDNYLSEEDYQIALKFNVNTNNVKEYRNRNGLNRTRGRGTIIKCKVHYFLGVKYVIERVVRQHEILFIGFVLQQPYHFAVANCLQNVQVRIRTIINNAKYKQDVTWEDVYNIRKEYDESDRKTVSVKKLSEKYNISYDYTREIIRNHTYIDKNYTYKPKKTAYKVYQIFEDEPAKSFNDWVLDERCHVDIKLLRARYKVGMRGQSLLDPPKKQKKYIIYEGEAPKTIFAWSQDPRADVSENTIRARLDAGVTGIQVIKNLRKEKYNNEVEIMGEKQTIGDWAKDSRAQISYHRLYNRLKSNKCRCLRILLKREYQEFFPCNCASAQSKSD